MFTPKEINENAAVVQNWGLALQRWSSTSLLQFLFLFAFIALVPIGAEYFYLNHLLAEDVALAQTRVQHVKAIGEENEFRSAIRTISSCIDAGADNIELKKWYCQEAVSQYLRVSKNKPQSRVVEATKRLAYRAMRSDVQGYLDFMQLQALSHAPPTGAQATLKFILSKTVVALWVCGVLAVLFGANLLLWVIPWRKHARPSA